MDALKDVWASIVEGIRDRTTNPLTFTFILSWSLWNYKFFVILLGYDKVKEKFEAIDNLYPHAPATLWGGALFYPVVSALVYIFLYPILGTAAIWAYRSWQVRASNIVKHVEKSRTLSPADAAELTRRHERERKAWGEESEAQASEIADLRRALEKAEEDATQATVSAPKPTQQEPDQDLQTLQTPFVSPPSNGAAQISESDAITPENLPPKELRILVHLSESSYARLAKDIAASLNMNYTMLDATLVELRQIGLLRTEIDQFKKVRWTLSEEGKKLVVRTLKGRRPS